MDYYASVLKNIRHLDLLQLTLEDINNFIILNERFYIIKALIVNNHRKIHSENPDPEAVRFMYFVDNFYVGYKPNTDRPINSEDLDFAIFLRNIPEEFIHAHEEYFNHCFQKYLGNKLILNADDQKQLKSICAELDVWDLYDSCIPILKEISLEYFLQNKILEVNTLPFPAEEISKEPVKAIYYKENLPIFVHMRHNEQDHTFFVKDYIDAIENTPPFSMLTLTIEEHTNEILDKISKYGMQSLLESELLFLKKNS